MKVQVPTPEQAPLHPAKVEPESADAKSVTTLPEGKLALQVSPQLIPLGEELTCPVPPPSFCTDTD